MDVAIVGSEQISLCNLVDKAEYERVTLKAQVIKIDDPNTVGGNKKKQEVSIADQTAAANLTLWQGDINSLELGQSYQFNRLVVCWQETPIIPPLWGIRTKDTGEVVDKSFEVDSEDTLVQSATIIGVKELVLQLFLLQAGHRRVH